MVYSSWLSFWLNSLKSHNVKRIENKYFKPRFGEIKVGNLKKSKTDATKYSEENDAVGNS